MDRIRVVSCVVLMGLWACSGKEDKAGAAAATTPPAEAPSAAAEVKPASPELLQKVLGTSEGVSDLVKRALGRAEQTLPQADLDKALAIYRAGGGETGRGKLHVAWATGFGENAWRQVAFMEFILQALSHPEVKKISYASARFDASKALSDIQAFVTQGVDVLVVYADHREALLPAMREASQAGIVVVPWSAPPGGTPGTDYAAFVGNDVCEVGKAFAKFAVAETGGNGKVVQLGGTPGNPYSATVQKCENEVYAGAAGMKVLGFADTMWTKEGTFKEASAFLAREPQIDAWHCEYADGARGIIRAYEAAKRPLDFVLTVAGDEQGLFGDWERLSPKNPKFKILHGPGGTSQIRVALSAGIEKKQGASIPANIDVPAKLRPYAPGSYKAGLPDEMPMSALVPEALIKQMFGK
jgi:ribose transport system substrate-binding protein